MLNTEQVDQNDSAEILTNYQRSSAGQHNSKELPGSQDTREVFTSICISIPGAYEKDESRKSPFEGRTWSKGVGKQSLTLSGIKVSSHRLGELSPVIPREERQRPTEAKKVYRKNFLAAKNNCDGWSSGSHFGHKMTNFGGYELGCWGGEKELKFLMM